MARQTSEAIAPRGPTSGIHSAVKVPEAKPVLASEALREELAPAEPGRKAIRVWLLAVAVVLVGLGIGYRAGLGAIAVRGEASTICFSAAGAVAAVALLPFPYALRAAVTLVLGGGLMALGFQGLGPLGGIAVDGGLGRDLTRLVALSALPATLLFRAQYRAYTRARVLLALALALSLPFVILEGLLVSDAAAPIVVRVAAACNVLVVICSCFGFMGSGTTGAGSAWAVVVLAVLPVEIGLRELTPLAGPEIGNLTYPATAVGLFCASVLTSTGIYQLFASTLARDARECALPAGQMAGGGRAGSSPQKKSGARDLNSGTP